MAGKPFLPLIGSPDCFPFLHRPGKEKGASMATRAPIIRSSEGQNFTRIPTLKVLTSSILLSVLNQTASSQSAT